MDKLKRYNEDGYERRNGEFCLSSDVEELEERLEAYEEDQRSIMSERCGDEVHCTCVPPLRAEVERLTALLGKSIVSGAIDITGHNVVEENERLTAELAQVKAKLVTVCEGWNLYVDTNGATRNNEAWGIVRRVLTQKEG